MNYEVELSAQADADLRGIYEYIAFTLLASENAVNQLDRLETGIISLEHYPMRHRAYEKEPWHSRGLRVLPVDNYVLLYIPKEDTKVVTVIRVLYGGRNIDKELKENTKEYGGV